MAFKSSIDSQLRGFYFAPNGNDSFSGETIEVPKLTIQAAVDAAALLSPPPSPGGSGQATVTSAQGGAFFDSVVCIDSCSIDGTNTSLNVTDSPISVTMGSSMLFNMNVVTNSQNDGLCLMLDGKSSIGMDVLFLGAFGTNATCANITGSVGDIFNVFRLLSVFGEGGTIFDITATITNPMDISFGRANLLADNTTFIDYNPVSGNCIVEGGTVVSDGSTGTTVANVQGGILTLNVDIVVSDMFADVSNDGRFGSKANGVTGDTLCRDTSVVNYKSMGFYQGDISVQDSAIFLGDIAFLIGDITLSGTSQAFVEASNQTGDITVGVGCTLTCVILAHAGTITINGTINGIIDGKRFGTYLPQVVLIAESFNNQNPTGLDAPLQVEFGAAQGTVSDPVMMDAAGEITINETGRYRASLFAQYGREGAGSASWLFFRGLRNGIQEQVSVLAKLDNANSDLPIQFEVTRTLEAGDVLVFQVIRDSQGFDSGGLISESPTPAGWLDSPSAHVTLIKE